MSNGGSYSMSQSRSTFDSECLHTGLACLGAVAVAEQRMLEKLTRSLTEDIAPLLPIGVRFDDNDAMQYPDLLRRRIGEISAG